MKINDLSSKIAKYGSEISVAADRVIRSGWWVLGKEVSRFERAFAEYVGCTHCVGVANGTDALELSLRAVGVGTGTLVATVANAGMYTTTAVRAIGGVPMFMDVALDSGNTTLNEVERAIHAGAKVVVVTHLYGQAIPEIRAMADYCFSQGIPLIEDCAQAHGASIENQRVGSFGTIAAFSFYPTKNLGALGDGGAVVTSDTELASMVAKLRQYGWEAKYQVAIPGGRNSRLDEMQAAFLNVFLPHLEEENAMRRSVAAKYTQGITNKQIILPAYGGAENVFHLYVIRSPRRDSLQSYLHAHDIMAEIHYPVPDYKQPILKQDFAHIALEQTERRCEEMLTLPCYPEMSDSQIETVIQAINLWEP